ncbi:MAG: hypothetical protein OQK04_09705, partial [Kangiellaceae bacterium]|nr:hypothetical protein [Kangiellaceae bacterium]
MSGSDYIFVTMLFFSIMLSVIFFIAWKTMEDSPHALTWSIVFLIAIINSIFNVGRELFPNRDIYWILVNATSLLQQGLALAGFRQRARLPAFPAWLIGYLVFIELLIIWFTIVDHHMGLRMAFTPFSAVIVLSACAIVIARSNHRLRAAEIGAIYVFVIYALVQLLSGSAALMQGAEQDEIYLSYYQQINFVAAPPAYAGIGLFSIFILADDLSHKMQRLAITDQLTGAMNRRGFDEAVRRAKAQAKREN